MSAPTLRPYRSSDEDAAIALWLRTWQLAYPSIDFASRVAWWRQRWRDELVAKAAIVIAEMDPVIVGFVTVERSNGYLDQIVVAPEHWGSGVATALLRDAKSIAPASGLALHVNADNARAIAFYRKNGFAITGDTVNPRSGAPVHVMQWSTGV